MAKVAGHMFLKKLGKRRLRPGGVIGTNFLMSHIEFKPGQKLLEVACNRGVNLLMLAKENPEVRFFGIDMDQESIDQANLEKEKQGLTNIEFVKGNALDLKFEDNYFDYVVNEAMLTMLAKDSKSKALNEYYRVLKNGGLLLTHDIALINEYEQTRKRLSKSINVNVSPMPKDEWIETFKNSGFNTIDSLQGTLTLMTPLGMIKDEGILNTIKIVINGLKKENREQFLTMRKTFKNLEHNMNYICFVNKK